MVIIREEKPKKIELSPLEREIIRDCLNDLEFRLVKFYGIGNIKKLFKKMK